MAPRKSTGSQPSDMQIPEASASDQVAPESIGRMRVLLLSEFYPPILGGLEIHVENLAIELRRRGHHLAVATLGNEPRISTRNGIDVHYLSSLSSKVPFIHQSQHRPFHPPLPDPLVHSQLRKLIRAFRPDVVHGHNWMAASVPRGQYALVMTAHDYSLVCPRRTLFNDLEEICSGPALIRCGKCAPQQYGRVRAAIIDVSTRIGRRRIRPDIQLCVSSAVAEAIRPVVRADIAVIPNFIPGQPSVIPTEVDIPSLPPGEFALFAGTPKAHKGIGVLQEAWTTGTPPCPLFIASLDGATVGWPEQVLTANLSRVQMAAAWQRATVAVVPSMWAEPCPTVALEAMAAGVPVVASRVGGLIDLIEDGVEGLLIPPGDPDALRNAVQSIIADPKLRAAMGDAGKRRVQSFTVPAVVSRIEEAYRRAIVDSHDQLA